MNTFYETQVSSKRILASVKKGIAIMEQEEIEHAILVRDLVSCLYKFPGGPESTYTALWFIRNIAKKRFTDPENKRLGLVSNRMEVVRYIRTNHKDIWDRLIKYLPVDYLEKGY